MAPETIVGGVEICSISMLLCMLGRVFGLPEKRPSEGGLCYPYWSNLSRVTGNRRVTRFDVRGYNDIHKDGA
jgi:hypothetical protein